MLSEQLKPIDQSYLHSLADLCNVVLLSMLENNQTVADTNLFHFIIPAKCYTYALPSTAS